MDNIKNTSNDLFLLMGQLFQLKDTKTVESVFIESVNTLVKGFSVRKEKSKSHPHPLAISTLHGKYGFLYSNIAPVDISRDFEMIFMNAVSMLGIILEKIHFKNKLDKRYKKDLKYREDLLKRTEKLSKVGGWEYDTKTGKIEWTDETYRIYGVKEEDFNLENLQDAMSFYPMPDRKKLEKAFKDAVENGTPYDLELSFISAQKEHKWVRTMGEPVLDKQGRIIKLVGNLMDVTNRVETETALQKSRERYYSFIRHSSEGIYLLEMEKGVDTSSDPEETAEAIYDNAYVAECNEAYAEMYNASSKDSLVDKRLEELHNGRHDPVNRKIVIDFIQSNYRITDKISKEQTETGNEVWFSNNAIGIIENGKLIRIWGTQTEITSLKETEKRLRESEEKFRNIFNNSADTIMIHDFEGNFLEVNDETCRRLGYSRDELMKMTPFSIDSSENQTDISPRIEEIKRKGSLVFETRHITKQKNIIPVEISSRIIDYRGETAIISVARDITKRIEANRKKDEYHRQLVSTLNSIGNLIMVVDKDLRIVICNWKDHEWVSEDDKKSNPLCYKVMKGLDKPCSYCPVLKTFDDGKKRWYEDQNPIDRSIKEISVSPIFDDQGNVEYVIENVIDVTKKKNIDKRLKQAEKMEAIGSLAGGIAHDFNNLLAGIIGYAEMSKIQTQPESSLADNMDKILQVGDRAKHLVNQILAFSRQNPDEKTPQNLRPIIKEVLELLRASLPSSIEIKSSLSRDTKPVLADPTKIHELLMNISTNAAHAMSDKGVMHITYQEEHFSEDINGRAGTTSKGLYSVIEIQDSGPGIEEEVLEHIFEPYFTTKEKGKGTGMGLAVSFGIICDHNGNVQVETAPGQGALFRIFLPKTEFNTEDRDEVESEGKQGKEHIMFIDDEVIMQEIAKDMLENLGYKVTVFSGSEAALEEFKKSGSDYEAVITDQTMPGLSGLELSERMLDIRGDLPIILCTGFSNSVNKKSVAASGISGFLNKPYRQKDIANMLREVLEGENK